MDDRKIKGAMLMDYVRTVKAFKNLDWNKYLEPEDWEIINSIVMPSSWYPFGFYNRIALASFYLVAEGKLENARASGRIIAQKLFEKTYKSLVLCKDPSQALQKFVGVFISFFNFSTLKFEKAGDRHVIIHHDYKPEKNENSAPEAFMHQMQGMYETLIEMNGGKNPQVSIIAEQWQGAPETLFDITWE